MTTESPFLALARRLALIAAAALALGGCASMSMPGSDYPRPLTLALQNPETTKLGAQVEQLAKAHAPLSGFRLLPVGPDGFIMRAQLAAAAERTLDVQYFIIQMDSTGRLFAGELLQAAERGVRVRLLLDDSNVAGRESEILSLAAHPNIEVRSFNPFRYRGSFFPLRLFEFAVNNRRLDYRMHNKLFVADNQLAIAGGRNIGDEYFQVGGDFEFGDYDVVAAGPIVRSLSQAFDSYWNSSISIPVQALSGQPPQAALEALRRTIEAERRELAHQEFVRRASRGEPLDSILSGALPLTWANARVVVDDPEKARVVRGELIGRLMQRPVADATSASATELIMVSPYLIPGDTGMRIFRELREKNVRVRILTNSLESTDVIGAHAAYTNYRDDLLDAGVELYEVRPVLGKPGGSGGTIQRRSTGHFALHAKTFVFDRNRLFIGSMNFDQRSLHLNTELGLIIDSPDLAHEVAARFESIVRPANSYRLLWKRDPATGSRRLAWRTENDKNMVEYDEEPASCSLQRIHSNLLALLPLEQEY